MKYQDLGSRMHSRPPESVGGFIQRTRSVVSYALLVSPARIVVAVFALIILIFTALLLLPAATRTGEMAQLSDAGFTAVSAVTVTGLSTVNTAEHWSFVGQLIILTAVQIGGLGVMTMASLLTLAVTERLGLSSRLLSMKDTGSSGVGDTRFLVRTVLLTTLVIELGLALIMAPRFIALTGDFLTGLWHAVFYSISAFCNAGFSLHPEGLVAYVNDPLIMAMINLGVIVGSLGAPTIMVLRRTLFTVRPGRRRSSRARLTLHAKLTLTMTVMLLVLGSVVLGLLEWSNPATLGTMSTGEKVEIAVTTSVMTRSGGYTLIEMDQLTPASQMLINVLMFIGGGSGSTAGGIKVTTLAVLLLAIVAEARGRRSVTAFSRQIPADTIKVAIAVSMGGAFTCLVAMMTLSAITGAEMEEVTFEVLSAFGTCGLSTGLSADTTVTGQLVLCVMMFLGRVGTITFASGLALRHSPTLYEYPEERPIIG